VEDFCTAHYTHCQTCVEADVPRAATGSPFGPRLHGLALYLKTFQALSFSRLSAMFGDVFGLKVSQGALVKMLARSHEPFAAQKQAIIERLRRAEMVASDETGIRIEAINGYQWVFLSPNAVVHEARMSRAGQVVRNMMAGHKPKIWLSDAYSAQQNHGAHQRTCLAHLARDVAYGLEASDDDLPFRLKLWLDKLFVLARNVENYAASTLETKKRQAENALADITAHQASLRGCRKAARQVRPRQPETVNLPGLSG
jgi:transposase